MDESEQDRIAATTSAAAAELLAATRRERDRRRAAGEDTAWLDEAVPQLEALVVQAHDLAVVNAIKHVVARHGPGPYPPEELAAIAGVDVATVRRVLDEMDAETDGPPETDDR